MNQSLQLEMEEMTAPARAPTAVGAAADIDRVALWSNSHCRGVVEVGALCRAERRRVVRYGPAAKET